MALMLCFVHCNGDLLGGNSAILPKFAIKFEGRVLGWLDPVYAVLGSEIAEFDEQVVSMISTVQIGVPIFMVSARAHARIRCHGLVRSLKVRV